MKVQNVMEILNHVRKYSTDHSQPELTVVNSVLSQSCLEGVFVSRQRAVNLFAPPVTVTSTGNSRLTAFCIGDTMKKHAIALYGSVALERGYCNNCKSMAIIKGGKFQCCGSPVQDVPSKFERMSEPLFARKTPTKADKDRIVNQQGNQCFYCGVTFGSFRFRRGLPFTIKIEWDHKLPFAYSQNNQTDNFVASCHVCNHIKSDHLFQTVDEARVYLSDKRKSKGYDF
jgi:5-methylcytosine-specific restriction endonuclease McrA